MADRESRGISAVPEVDGQPEIVALGDPVSGYSPDFEKPLLSGKVELSALRCTTNPVTWVSLSV